MTKSTVPSGAKQKEKCPKCGRLYYNFTEKGKQSPRNVCTICKPMEGDEK